MDSASARARWRLPSAWRRVCTSWGAPAASPIGSAGAAHHGEDQLVDAGVVGEVLDVAHHDVDPLAGRDVGDRLREDVRPLLLEERGSVALPPGGLVDPSRLLA